MCFHDFLKAVNHMIPAELDRKALASAFTVEHDIYVVYEFSDGSIGEYIYDATTGKINANIYRPYDNTDNIDYEYEAPSCMRFFLANKRQMQLILTTFIAANDHSFAYAPERVLFLKPRLPELSGNNFLHINSMDNKFKYVARYDDNDKTMSIETMKREKSFSFELAA